MSAPGVPSKMLRCTQRRQRLVDLCPDGLTHQVAWRPAGVEVIYEHAAHGGGVGGWELVRVRERLLGTPDHWEFLIPKQGPKRHPVPQHNPHPAHEEKKVRTSDGSQAPVNLLAWLVRSTPDSRPNRRLDHAGWRRSTDSPASAPVSGQQHADVPSFIAPHPRHTQSAVRNSSAQIFLPAGALLEGALPSVRPHEPTTQHGEHHKHRKGSFLLRGTCAGRQT